MATIVDFGQLISPYTQLNAEAGKYARLTASGAIKAAGGILLGFYVANTSSGTITLYDNTAGSGTQMSGLITPAVGWNPFPAIFLTGAYATIGGSSLDVTFIYL